MLSDRLAQFFRLRCGIDSDPEEVVEALLVHPNAGLSLWLQKELRAAVLAGDLTPEVVADLTGSLVPTPERLDEWLRALWGLWFPAAPYPTDEVDGSSAAR